MQKRIVILIILLGATLITSAQYEKVTEARRLYQAKQFTKARSVIDEAIDHPELSADAYAWLIRGYIYKDIYKRVDKGDPNSSAREQALEFAMKAMELDTTKDQVFFSDGYKLYDHLVKTYYNDAARAMNQMDHKEAQRYFEKYETTVRILTPDADLDQKEVEFFNALATVYTKLYNEDREKLEYFKSAISSYQKVMYIDKENYGANYNMATMWYNRGVYNIQQISPENDIPSINRIQEVSKEFFMQALPYMLKAFEQDSTRKETLMGLEGIYYSLQDIEKSDQYRAKIKELYGVGE